MISMNNNASLLSAQSRGGAVARKGYSFQDAFIASRIPNWLAEPSFRMLLNEGAGDVEVAFQKNGKWTRDFYQVKDHTVSPKECAEVINEFLAKDKQSPGTWDKFVLACRGLGKRAESLRQGLEDLQKAAPMYTSQDKVLTNTKEHVITLAKNIHIGASLDFLRNKVFFDTELGDMKTDDRLCSQFIGDLISKIPKWERAGLVIASAYRDVCWLLSTSIRQPITREHIEEVIDKVIQSSSNRIVQEGIRVRLYHWEDPAFDLSEEWDILLDWSEHFDRKTRKVPDPALWRNELIPALENAQMRIRDSTNSRLIRFSPHACLSAGFALGWAFSEVMGYTFEIKQVAETWRTDSQEAPRRFLISSGKSINHSSRELCVEFGQSADIAKKLMEFKRQSKVVFRAHIALKPELGIGKRIDGPTALAYARHAKRIMREAVDFYQCNKIHLFYAGPLGLAIFMGRLFNAMHADIQCYEEQKKGYVPTCLLRAH